MCNNRRVNIFVSLFIKLLPLYGIIFLGYLVGRFTRVKKEFVASFVMYGITPIIVFNAVFTTPISYSSILLPLVTLGISCVICGFFYSVGKFLWGDSRKNALGFIAGEANTGYFGLPLAILLFDSPTVELYVVAAIGILLYESTLGFFVAARGHSSVRDSLKKLLKLPAVYAVVAGAFAQSIHVGFGPLYDQSIIYAKYVYTLFGMMIIGLAIAGMKRFLLDWSFVGMAFLAKFVAWPLLTFLVIFLDQTFLHLFDGRMHNVFLLLSIVPIAANTVAFATVLTLYPEKIAAAVILTTVAALIYVPLMAAFFLQ